MLLQTRQLWAFYFNQKSLFSHSPPKCCIGAFVNGSKLTAASRVCSSPLTRMLRLCRKELLTSVMTYSVWTHKTYRGEGLRRLFPRSAFALMTHDLSCYRTPASVMQPWLSRHLSRPLARPFSGCKGPILRRRTESVRRYLTMMRDVFAPR